MCPSHEGFERAVVKLPLWLEIQQTLYTYTAKLLPSMIDINQPTIREVECLYAGLQPMVVLIEPQL